MGSEETEDEEEEEEKGKNEDVWSEEEREGAGRKTGRKEDKGKASTRSMIQKAT